MNTPKGERYWKRPLSEEELLQLVEITEEQAENSDAGGDSDADDQFDCLTSSNMPSTSGSNTPSSSFCSEGSLSSATRQDPSQNSTLRPTMKRAKLDPPIDFSDYDSDDSVADRTYKPDSPTPLQNRLLSFDSDDDLGERAEQIEEFSAWSKTPTPPTRYMNFNFSEETGPKVQVESEKPYDFFEIMFTQNFLEHIVQQSNLYAEQMKINLQFSVEELKAFLGTLIIMGLDHLPSLRLYWSRDRNFYKERITEVFPIKRFLKILRCLHLNDNQNMPARGTRNFDKLYKIRPLLTHFSEVYSESFTPSRNVAIDESMIGFKGRISLKQYMPLKPVKRGFKVWALACSETGYLYAFDIYQGKEEAGPCTLGERVVLKLLASLENKGFCAYFDNFFTTIPLMRKLADKSFFGCGTIRQTRKHFPKAHLIEDKKIAMGQSDFAVCEEISIVKWKDRGTKSVTVCSNMHNAADTGQVLRTNKTGERETVACPRSIVDYNKFMGGVDRFDQRLESYCVSWKSRRWWMKLFYYFIDSSIVNAYIIYKQTLKKNNPRKKPMSHLKFRSLLADQLIGNFTARKKLGPLPLRNYFANASHFPVKTTKRRCQECSKRHFQKRTNYMCHECQVALCVECFGLYHTN